MLTSASAPDIQNRIQVDISRETTPGPISIRATSRPNTPAFIDQSYNVPLKELENAPLVGEVTLESLDKNIRYLIYQQSTVKSRVETIHSCQACATVTATTSLIITVAFIWAILYFVYNYWH